MKTILITGGSGMIGRALSALLLEKGYRVIWLSRERFIKAAIPRYRWDYRKGEIDMEAVSQADVIVHLAGKNISDGPWSRSAKQRMMDSRVKTAQLLLDSIKKSDHKPEAFISASAVGFYGNTTTETIFTEDMNPDVTDLLGRISHKWEDSATRFTSEAGIRSVVLRTGFVLSEKSEGFRKMFAAAKFGLGAPLGRGKQYLSWIHIDDVCRMYLQAIEDSTMSGAYNAVAPEQITNSRFMRTMAGVMKRPRLLPNVPAFMLRMLMGEMADMLLRGSRISANKILKTGFEFRYATTRQAITACVDAIKKKKN